MTESNYPPFPIPSRNPSAACDNNLTHAGQAFKLPLLIIFKNYNPRHIKLGHPVQLPYCGKTLCSFPPSAENFLLLWCQLAKTSIEEAQISEPPN